MPLSHWKNTDYAVFVGAHRCTSPTTYDDPDATANANLGAKIALLFAHLPFRALSQVHVRDKIGSYKERGDHGNRGPPSTKWIMKTSTRGSDATRK